MKERASLELARDGYSTFFEPPFAPSWFLRWSSYRPDVFGMRTGRGRQDYALVECETRPSSRRLESKNFRTVQIQGTINSEVSLRRILVIPRGTLRRVGTSTRLSWEMWIYEAGSFQQFPSASERPGPPR
jgi:hypothetical protein